MLHVVRELNICFSFSAASCLSKLYLMAFTSGASHAGSDTSHSIQVQLGGHKVGTLQLYDRPGDDMLGNKGDLWKINFSDFHLLKSCITIDDIKKVSIVESGNDGWNIDSVVTLVKDFQGRVQILTQDLDVYRWIDGDGSQSHKHFDLTFA